MRAQTDQGARHGQEQGQPVPLRSGRPERAALGQAHGPGWRGAEASRACLLRLPEQPRAAQGARGSARTDQWGGGRVEWQPMGGIVTDAPAPDRRTAGPQVLRNHPAPRRAKAARTAGEERTTQRPSVSSPSRRTGKVPAHRRAQHTTMSAQQQPPAAPGSASAARASRLALRRVRTSDADAGKWEAGGLLL